MVADRCKYYGEILDADLYDYHRLICFGRRRILEVEMVNESTSSSDAEETVRRTKLIAVWVSSVFVVLNIVAFLIMTHKINEYQRAINNPPVPLVVSDYKLKDFEVVNAHDHLYKQTHLPKYFRAAEKTGVTRTLFVASSGLTLLGSSSTKDKMNDWNSEEILAAAEEHSGKIIPFCTIYPGDPEKLEKVKRYVDEGASGLKLYSGHSNFHDRPLDIEDMLPVYAYCEETGLPVCWHVNLVRYRAEFQRVMKQFPNMTVIVPHFGVAFWRPEKDLPWMAELLDTYPNLYTDTSLGTRQILVDGLERVSRYRHLFREFCTKYSDRILFGTDMVVTGNPEKTAEWIESVIRACRDMLEKDVYHFFMAARGSKYVGPEADPYGTLRGLELNDDVLRKIYETNVEKLFPPQ